MVLHWIPRVKGCVKPQNSLCADSASVRPSYIFPISNSIHPDLAEYAKDIHLFLFIYFEYFLLVKNTRKIYALKRL
jgi:hypothetical protein